MQAVPCQDITEFQNVSKKTGIIKLGEMNFNDIGLVAPLLKAIEEIGYTTPTEIQKQAIPKVLTGRDIIGCAQTGTGKTGAFALPILQLTSKEDSTEKHPRTLILVPTRELAIQIDQSITLYSKHLRIRHLVIFGGVSQQNQVAQLQKGVDILVATPGRLLDLVQQKHIHLGAIRRLVLDEADNMLDMGFIHDLKKILKLVPEKRQTLFFSATMPKPIRKLADSILTNPIEINVDPISSTAEEEREISLAQKTAGRRW
jgi:ATP-dependent RNA helicase RhlE